MAENDAQLFIGANIAELEKALKAAQAAVEAATHQMSNGFGVMASKIFAHMQHMGSGITSAVNKSASDFKSLDEKISKTTALFSKLGEFFLVGLGVGKFAEMVKHTAELGETLEHTAQKTGLTTTAVQELNFAAKMNDVSTEAMDKGLRKLAVGMTEAQRGSLMAVQAFKSVGLSANELSHMTLEDTLKRIADKYSQSADGAGKMASAQQLLGRTGSELIPMLNKGSAGLADYADKLREIGELTPQEVSHLAALDDQMKEASASTAALKNRISLALMPAFSSMLTAFSESAKEGGVLRTALDILGFSLQLIHQAAVIVGGTFEKLGNIIGGVGALVTEFFSIGGKGKMIETWKEMGDKAVEIEKDTQAKLLQITNPDINLSSTKPSQDKHPPINAGGNIAAAKKSAKDKFDAMIEGLKLEMDAEKTNGEERVRIAAEIAEKEGEKYGFASKEFIAAQKTMLDEARKNQENLNKIAEEHTLAERNHSVALINIKREEQSAELSLGKINKQEKLAAEKQLQDQVYQIDLYALKKKLELQDKNSLEYQKVLSEIQALDDKHNLETQKSADETVIAVKAKWNNILGSVSSAFETSINGIIMGTTTLQKAMANMAQSILGEFVKLGVKMVINWATTQFAMTTSTAAGTAARSSIAAAGAAADLAAHARLAIAHIMGDAAQTFGGVFANLSPVMGPFAAGPAAVAAAMVAAKSALVPSAAMGYDIPSGVNPMTQLHQREMVLPAKYADTIRGMADGGVSGSAVHFHVSAIDASSVAKFFKDNGDHIVKSLHAQHRGFATP